MTCDCCPCCDCLCGDREEPEYEPTPEEIAAAEAERAKRIARMTPTERRLYDQTQAMYEWLEYQWLYGE